MIISSINAKLISLILILFLVSGCFEKAEHKNPLDPQSSNFSNVGQVTVTTQTFYSPRRPLSDVELTVEPGNIIINSDENGQAVMSDFPVGNYFISAAKAGYATAGDSIRVELGRTIGVTLPMDGLPFVQTASITSSRIGRWFPTSDLLLLQVAVSVADPDGLGDIRLVELEIPELGYVDTLNVVQTAGVFEKILQEVDLPGRNLQNLIGKNFVITMQDEAGFKSTSEPFGLSRIIEPKPQTESPQGIDNPVDPTNLIFTWRPVSIPFDYFFEVNIFQVNFGLNLLIWTSEIIDNSNTSLNVSEILPTGNYAWTVAVVDEFGNRSVSKEASFRVN